MEACQGNAVVLREFLLLKLCGGRVPAPLGMVPDADACMSNTSQCQNPLPVSASGS